MAVNKVWIDEKKKRCIICGLCELIAPNVFTVTDKTHVNKNVNLSQNEAQIREAVEGCPQDIIKMETRK
jgi:ferredoxin